MRSLAIFLSRVLIVVVIFSGLINRLALILAVYILLGSMIRCVRLLSSRCRLVILLLLIIM